MKILYTDRAWDTIAIETQLLSAAGHELIDCRLEGAPAERVTAAIREHQPDGLLVCFAPINADALQASARLRAVSRMGIGLDNIAVTEARMRGISVTNVPEYCLDEVASHTLALILALRRQLVPLNAMLADGQWEPGAFGFRRIQGSVIGIIGCGKIGSLVAAKATGVGMRPLGFDPQMTSHPNLELTDLDTLLAKADVISLHAPLAESTRHLVNEAFLARMKPSALLINTSRGPLVNTAALVRALDEKRIGGAGLDTIEGEPAVPVELRGRSNVLLTPHVAFASHESLEELRRTATHNLLTALGRSSMA